MEEQIRTIITCPSLTSRQCRVLCFLVLSPHVTRQADIADALGCTLRNVSYVLSCLYAAKIVSSSRGGRYNTLARYEIDFERLATLSKAVN